MHWVEHLRATFSRLRRRPVATLLLLQGTIWGVAVAIFPVAVLEGTRASALSRGAEIGADRISIVADPTATPPSVLDAADLSVLQEALVSVTPEPTEVGALRLLREADASGVTVLAASPRAPLARGLELEAGRWLNDQDGPRACVVEAGVATRLKSEPLLPGMALQLPNWPDPLQVVGVTRARSSAQLRTNDLGFDLEHALYRSVAQPLLFAMGVPVVRDDWKRSEACVYLALAAGGEVDWMFARLPPLDVLAGAQAVRDALSVSGRSVVTLHPLVLPVLLGDEVNRFQRVSWAMFLACLVMGSVVIANVGLLSVLQRTREFAVRRVEGATRRTIATQILGEGALLAFIGSLIGCGLGTGLAQLRVELEPVQGFTWVFPTAHAALACGVSLAIGLLAAVLPALRAMRQDPVEGLADD